MLYKTSKQTHEEKNTHSLSCQSPLTIWWLWQSHVLEIIINTKISILITVEYILAQRKIFTIGIIFLWKWQKLELSCSGISWVVHDLVSFFLIGSLHWQLPYNDNFPTLNNPLTTFYKLLHLFKKLKISSFCV